MCLLKIVTRNKILLLQLKENERYCDIKPEEKIPDQSDIQVLLINVGGDDTLNVLSEDTLGDFV